VTDEEIVLAPEQTYTTATKDIGEIPLSGKLRFGWVAGFAVSFFITMALFTAIGYLFLRGIGIWGVNVPIAWGLAIVNFVWWIGIGHAGTLISAILLLLKQTWRTSINRFADRKSVV
jgi:molybdopterin-containing oxidoreductase family membrane subunit